MKFFPSTLLITFFRSVNSRLAIIKGVFFTFDFVCTKNLFQVEKDAHFCDVIKTKRKLV